MVEEDEKCSKKTDKCSKKTEFFLKKTEITSKSTLSSIARVKMSAAHLHNRITRSPEKSKKEKEFKDYFKLKMVSFSSLISYLTVLGIA